jgi:hypothetical protein
VTALERIAALGIAIGWFAAAPEARAQDPADLPPDTGSDALRAGTEQRRAYWRGTGPVRPFLASVIELGAFHVRPWLQAGYGKPHYEWFGAEIYQSMSVSGGRSYAGIRGTWPYIDVRGGWRYEFPTSTYLMPRKDSYEREDMENPAFGRSTYLAAEAELSGTIPVPNGSIIAVATLGVPDDRLLLEQALKVVTEPPWMWRARVGYLYHFGWQGTLRLGVSAEVIHPIRRQDVVVRAGPLMSAALTHHLEANAAIMVVAYSPDSLGLAGADLGQIGLRYRWATGDRFPEFP